MSSWHWRAKPRVSPCSLISCLSSLTGPCIPRSQTQLSCVKKLGFLYVSKELTCYPFVWLLKSDSFARMTLRVFITLVPARTTPILRACLMVAWHGTGPFPLIWIGRGLVDTDFPILKLLGPEIPPCPDFSQMLEVCLRPCFFPRFSPKSCMCPLCFRIPKSHDVSSTFKWPWASRRSWYWLDCLQWAFPSPCLFFWNQSHWK